VHQLHDLAVGDGAVAAQKNALVPIPRCCGGQSVREAVARHRIIAQGETAVGFEGEVDRLRRPLLLWRGGSGQIDRHEDRGKRRRHHENDQEHQHHVDVVNFNEFIGAVIEAYRHLLTRRLVKPAAWRGRDRGSQGALPAPRRRRVKHDTVQSAEPERCRSSPPEWLLPGRRQWQEAPGRYRARPPRGWWYARSKYR